MMSSTAHVLTSCLEGLRFKSRRGDRLALLYFLFSTVPRGECWKHSQNRPRLLSSIFFLIAHPESS